MQRIPVLIEKFRQLGEPQKTEVWMGLSATAFILLLLLTALIITIADPSKIVIEAETLNWYPAGSPTIFNDNSATDGRVVTLKNVGAGTLSRVTNSIQTLTVRANGIGCDGSPTMQVTLDGKLIAIQNVSSGWKDYTYHADTPTGNQNIVISFVNAYSSHSCKRILGLDKITLHTVAKLSPATQISRFPGKASNSASPSPSSSASSSSAPSSANPSPSKSTSSSPPKPSSSSSAHPSSPSSQPSPSHSPSSSPNPSTPPSGPQPTGTGGTWTLKFDDEFSGASLDRSKWANCWNAPNCNKVNNTTSSPSNVAVTGGNLVLTLSSSDSGAAVTTDNHGGASTGYTFGTGVVEARIYFPGDGSHCFNWPTFWTNGQQSNGNDGENDTIDILNGYAYVYYRYGSSTYNQGGVSGYWCGGYHVYTLQRNQTKSYVFFDGILQKSFSTNDNGAPEYIVLNVGASSSSGGVGGLLGGTPTYNSYGNSSQVKIDYVRGWQ
jgi:hypothetical protein